MRRRAFKRRATRDLIKRYACRDHGRARSSVVESDRLQKLDQRLVSWVVLTLKTKRMYCTTRYLLGPTYPCGRSIAGFRSGSVGC